MIRGKFKGQVYSCKDSMRKEKTRVVKPHNGIKKVHLSRRATSASATQDVDMNVPQVTTMERGGPLPPHRSQVRGEGSSTPPSKVHRGNPPLSTERPEDRGELTREFEEGIQVEEDMTTQEAQEEDGPFLITTPKKDPQHARRVIRWNRKWTEVAKERKKDPYVYEQLSSDPCFWNHFQQDYYETVLQDKKGAILMQWIDWKYMEGLKDLVVDEVIEACNKQHLKELMALQYPWCKEIIAQFYATVYFEPNIEKTIHWMTNGVRYSVTYAKFAAILGFPARLRTNRCKIHNENALDTNTLHFMYQDVDYELGTIKGLLPFYAYLNKILRKTLSPKEGDAGNVLAYTRNIMYKMGERPKHFDVFDFIFEEIRIISMMPKRGLSYGPYIMKMIEIIAKKKFYKEVSHTGYQIRPIKAVHVQSRRATRASTRAGTSSSVTKLDSNSSLRYFKAIFNMCKSISIRQIKECKERKKNTRMFKLLLRNSNYSLRYFKAIFNMCKSISVRQIKERKERKKNTRMVKLLLRNSNLPCSPDGSELNESEEEVIEDPFAAKASSSRVDRGKAPVVEEDDESSSEDDDEDDE